jgi:hypothetical protein
MTRGRLVAMTFLDRNGMVQKSRPILDTLGRSMGPPVGLYLSTLQLVVPTTILDAYTGGTRPRMDPGPGDGWLP